MFVKVLDIADQHCPHCGVVSAHALYSRNPFQTGPREDPREALVARCVFCWRLYALRRGDLRATYPARLAEATEVPTPQHCKLLDRSRLVLDDWVYVAARRRVGRVVRRSRTGPLETFRIDLGEDGLIEASYPPEDRADPKALRLFTLIPEGIAECRIGDWVFHTGLELEGQVLGLVHRGDGDRLAVRMQDGSIRQHQIAGNGTDANSAADSAAADLLEHLDLTHLHATCEDGLVILQGTAHSLAEVEHAASALRQLPGVIEVWPECRVVPSVFESDMFLELQVSRWLATAGWRHLLGARAHVDRGVLRLSGFMDSPKGWGVVRHFVLGLDGLRGFDNRLQPCPPSSTSDLQEAQAVQSALQNSVLSPRSIRVACFEGKLYLAGCVHNQLQRQSAAFAAMWASKRLQIVNELKVA